MGDFKHKKRTPNWREVLGVIIVGLSMREPQNLS